MLLVVILRMLLNCSWGIMILAGNDAPLTAPLTADDSNYAWNTGCSAADGTALLTAGNYDPGFITAGGTTTSSGSTAA